MKKITKKEVAELKDEEERSEDVGLSDAKHEELLSNPLYREIVLRKAR